MFPKISIGMVTPTLSDVTDVTANVTSASGYPGIISSLCVSVLADKATRGPLCMAQMESSDAWSLRAIVDAIRVERTGYN